MIACSIKMIPLFAGDEVRPGIEEQRDFHTVPREGEYVAFRLRDEVIYLRVEHIVHLPGISEDAPMLFVSQPVLPQEITDGEIV